MCKVYLAILLFHIAFFVPFESKITSGHAEFWKKEGVLEGKPMKKFPVIDRIQCAASCFKSLKCMSFAFHENECEHLYESYPTAESTVSMPTRTNYYHFEDKHNKSTISERMSSPSKDVPRYEYLVVNAPKSYQEAQAHCSLLRKGGKLACIHDINDQKNVMSALKKNVGRSGNFWIGLTGESKGYDTGDCISSYNFFWEDSKALDYSNFKPCDNTIKIAAENVCTFLDQLDSLGRWIYTFQCDTIRFYPFVCQIPPSTPQLDKSEEAVVS